MKPLSEPPIYTPKIQPSFVILGFLVEYLGRRIVEQGDIVESFHPTEKDDADVFESNLVNLISSWGGNISSIQRLTGHQDWINFKSFEITAHINAFYNPTFSNESTYTTLDGQKFRYDTCLIPETIFQPATVQFSQVYDARFSYLLGAYQRFGKGNTFQFTNAPHKVRLIVKLLNEISCDYVAWKTWPTRVPVIHEIEFEPSRELKILLDLKDNPINE